MKRYAEYKDSGVEWIGEIPSHWSVKRNKYFTEPQKIKSSTGEEELLSVSEHHGVIPRSTIREGEEHISRSDSFVGYLKVSKDQLVSNIMLMWKTGLGVSQYDGLVSPAYSVFSFSTGCPRYFHFLFRTSLYTTEYRKNSTGVIESRLRLYDDVFGLLFSHFPPPNEQQQIVDYLDQKTALIDSLIEKTERKIELLKEKRTALINQVVTKGLNPDVEMKDSGVEWIGEIPRHWGTTRIKWAANGAKDSFIDGDWIESKDLSDAGIRYITTGNIGLGKYKEQGNGYISEETFVNLNCKELVEGDLIISRLSLPIGRSCILPKIHYKVVTSVDNVILRPDSRLSKQYLNYLFNSARYFEHTELISRGVTLTRISRGMLGNISIPVPPLVEQQNMCAELDRQVSSIDETVGSQERRVILLMEYRQSLISEVVTGKIKVTSDA